MSDELPGRPTRNNSSFQMRERLQVYLVYLLLVLGIGWLWSRNSPLSRTPNRSAHDPKRIIGLDRGAQRHLVDFGKIR